MNYVADSMDIAVTDLDASYVLLKTTNQTLQIAIRRHRQ